MCTDAESWYIEHYFVNEAIQTLRNYVYCSIVLIFIIKVVKSPVTLWRHYWRDELHHKTLNYQYQKQRIFADVILV